MRGSAAFRAAVAPGGVLAGPWVKNELWRRARAVPSLDLRFADNKSLRDAVTGQSLITFTRASSGTFTGSDGLIATASTDVPRFDHNPTTGESLGLLVEEARTNLLLRSEEFDNASWDLAAGTGSANATTAPSGSLTADKLIAATTPGTTGQLFQSVTITSGATVTGSLFVKDGGFDRLEIVLLSNNNTTPYGRATFNPIAGTITTAASTANGGTNASASVVAYGNGWYRLILTVTYPAVTAAGMRILSFNSDSAVGDGVKGVFLWGAQLEAGAFPTSVIPTTTATVTRSADVASISGSNFSSWANAPQGTLFTQAATAATHGGVNSFPRIASISDGTTNSIIEMFYRVLAPYTDTGYLVASSGATQAAFETNAGANNSSLAVAYAVDNFAFSRNGLIANTDASGNLPTFDRLFIGSRLSAVNILGGTIRRLTYWPTRLGNEVLQRLTQP